MGWYQGIDDAKDESARQAAAALSEAMALAAQRQAAARTFIETHGHEVVSGHAPITQGQDQRGRDA